MAEAKTNFLAFNEEMNSDRTFSDSEYLSATQRLSGVTPGMANSRLHNKMYRQSSAMAKAIADFLVTQGYSAMDNDLPGLTGAIEQAVTGIANEKIVTHNNAEGAHADIRRALKEAGLNILRRSHAYAIGDIAYSASLPSWARLECVQSGTTAEVELDWTNVVGGGYPLK